MVITPTCHVSEGEKDEDVVAVVPVEALNLVIPDLPTARNVRAGKNVPLHMFPLGRTALGNGILGFDGVALLDSRCARRSSVGRSELSSEHHGVHAPSDTVQPPSITKLSPVIARATRKQAVR